jgi:hypothetical protein
LYIKELNFNRVLRREIKLMIVKVILYRGAMPGKIKE